MKFRTGFVTNSSSNVYIIRNKTDTMKNMLDVLKECALDRDSWELVDWLPDRCKEENEDPPFGDEYLLGVTLDGKELPAQERQLFLETVASLKEFPPHTDVKCWFSMSNSTYGDIRVVGGLRSSKNFRVEYLGV